MIILIMRLVEFLLQHLFIDRKRIYNLLSRFQSDSSKKERDSKPYKKKKKKVEERKDGGSDVSKRDLQIVLRSLGMVDEEAKLPERLDLKHLFEEKIPRLDEVKEAFDVFDNNRDGFIDAEELHKVLLALGLNEIDDKCCRIMIQVYDQNGDGRIDFDEFVTVMETSFC